MNKKNWRKTKIEQDRKFCPGNLDVLVTQPLPSVSFPKNTINKQTLHSVFRRTCPHHTAAGRVLSKVSCIQTGKNVPSVFITLKSIKGI